MRKRKRRIEIKENKLDKAIEFVAPRTALKRREARLRLALHSAYEGASKSKSSLKLFNPWDTDADSAMLYERQTLVDRSRDLIRNNPIAGGAINTKCTNIIGSGLQLHSKVDAELLGMTDEQADEWEKHVEREFRLWAETQECDIERTLNFYELQELSFRQFLENGDHFVLTPRIRRSGSPYSLRLQMIEADRVSNPTGKLNGKLPDSNNRLYDGIEKDSIGAPVKYHICRQHPGSRLAGKEWKEVQAFGKETGLRNVLHIYRVLRSGQTRGIPILTPVIESLRQLQKYTEAELMAAVISGMLTVFVKTESGNPDFSSVPSAQSTGNTSEEDDYELGNGSIIGLHPGEDVETVNPGRPNSAFDPFIISILKQIAVGLEMPFEVLMKHFTKSYSASRGAILEAWRVFKSRRAWFAGKFCNPIYEIWMWEAAALGRITAPGFFDDPLIRKAYLGAEWVGPSQGHIDPYKEINAAEKRVALGISTRKRETREYSGEDFDRNKVEIRKENKFFKEINNEAD